MTFIACPALCVAVEVVLSRKEDGISRAVDQHKMHAQLLVGTQDTDAVLQTERIAMNSFHTPHTIRVTVSFLNPAMPSVLHLSCKSECILRELVPLPVGTPSNISVVAALILERCAGRDITQILQLNRQLPIESSKLPQPSHSLAARHPSGPEFVAPSLVPPPATISSYFAQAPRVAHTQTSLTLDTHQDTQPIGEDQSFTPGPGALKQQPTCSLIPPPGDAPPGGVPLNNCAEVHLRDAPEQVGNTTPSVPGAHFENFAYTGSSLGKRSTAPVSDAFAVAEASQNNSDPDNVASALLCNHSCKDKSTCRCSRGAFEICRA
eukprot:1175817-Prorocentrum_minimum.AAC.10